jgi:CubicO group peptidase (beta-lactamase class C family)
VHDHTVFEIGSDTTLLTATLLAVMAQDREVALDDPGGKLLAPAAIATPSILHQITLENLANTSGSPTMPTNATTSNPRTPLAATPSMTSTPSSPPTPHPVHRAPGTSTPTGAGVEGGAPAARLSLA